MARINFLPWVYAVCVLSLVALSPVTADQHVDSSHLLEKIYTRLQAAEKKISLQDEKIDHQNILIKKLQIELRQMRREYSEGHKESHKVQIDHNRNKRQLNLQSSILSYVKNATKTVGSSGSVYTRWGRTSCEGGASLLYSGFAGGAQYNTYGGGVNLLCMPLDPEYNKFSTSGSFSYLHGAEYESSNLGIFSDKTHDENVPCARCYSPHSVSMMVPGKRTCPKSWTKQYEGYLMTGHNGALHSYQYECVDETPEFVIGQQANTNGARLYFVKPDCDGDGTTGHCPPYEEGKQLTCVMCSK